MCGSQAASHNVLSRIVLQWAASEPSPFDLQAGQSQSLAGYLSTADIYDRLGELLNSGDVEADDLEHFSVEDVGAALGALYERQQQQLEPLGMLSRMRMGIGRLWRIIPPSAEAQSDGPEQSPERLRVRAHCRTYLALPTCSF